jgi:hypothetical protein
LLLGCCYGGSQLHAPLPLLRGLQRVVWSFGALPALDRRERGSSSTIDAPNACIVRSAIAMRSVRLFALNAVMAERTPPVAVWLLDAVIAAFRGACTCTTACSTHKSTT